MHRNHECTTAELLDDVRRLYELCTPVTEIAQYLHLTESDVRFIIQRGRLPQRQLDWKEVPHDC